MPSKKRRARRPATSRRTDKTHRISLLATIRYRRVLIAFVAVILVAALAIGAWFTFAAGAGPSQKRAVIVDQLSLTAPDPQFVTSSTRMLSLAGYHVDYVNGKDVDVDFYRHLATHHYDVVVLRVHSGLTTITNEVTGTVTKTQSVSLFTGQPYDTNSYATEQGNGWLGRSRYLEDGQQVLGVFGVEPEFIRYAMDGTFDHTLVVLMGCNGVDAPTMAQAFIARGASAVVGWDNFVSAGFTDSVTLKLLHALYADRTPLAEAVSQTRAQSGRDPTFGGALQLVDRLSSPTTAGS
jgi:hypothetical protein